MLGILCYYDSPLRHDQRRWTRRTADTTTDRWRTTTVDSSSGLPSGRTPLRRRARRTWCESWARCRWRISRRQWNLRPTEIRLRWSCSWTPRCTAPWWPCKTSGTESPSPRWLWTHNNVAVCEAVFSVPLACTGALRLRSGSSSAQDQSTHTDISTSPLGSHPAHIPSVNYTSLLTRSFSCPLKPITHSNTKYNTIKDMQMHSNLRIADNMGKK